MTGLMIRVVGSPAPQGSKSAFRNKYTGRIQQVESSKNVKPWRQDVKDAALQAREQSGHETFTGPVRVHIVFGFLRTKGHYGSGRNAAALKPSAPPMPCSKSTYDIDKLARSTLDALTQAGVFADDAQVYELRAVKVYCEGRELPGANIVIEALAPQPVGAPAAAVRQETLL